MANVGARPTGWMRMCRAKRSPNAALMKIAPDSGRRSSKCRRRSSATGWSVNAGLCSCVPRPAGSSGA